MFRTEHSFKILAAASCGTLCVYASLLNAVVYLLCFGLAWLTASNIATDSRAKIDIHGFSQHTFGMKLNLTLCAATMLLAGSLPLRPPPNNNHY